MRPVTDLPSRASDIAMRSLLVLWAIALATAACGASETPRPQAPILATPAAHAVVDAPDR